MAWSGLLATGSKAWPVARFDGSDSGAKLLTLAEPYSHLERLDAALAAALEQIRSPAFVLSPSGEIQETNEAGLRRLNEDASGVAAQLLASARDNDGDPSYDVAPLRRGGADSVLGYLAVERPSPARATEQKDRCVAQAAARSRLTRRQAEVLSCVADGATNARIAANLGISERTAESHVAAILSRSGAASRAELIASLLK
jgi:DNA-binding CsgD family transcriptional regulator